ncbi:polyadenylate-binding protein, cytoplasmic and nuclear isoform X1 [Brassica rapa]|uniref:polyadenylate-binding protein, cytoplasmic and nuclear isoform X1 n=1 Tax=Brassica campestris TaxID=3711 RepID=UPI0004F19522|nr:polyadenylate-binding protein, cytoplasmic and nuclear isoform X1 [Brassica rapa]
MASCSQKANLLGKRKPEDGFGTELVLKKHKEKFEEKETEARVELLSDEANSVQFSVTVETEPILKGIREEKETAIGFFDEIKGRVELLENEANLISVEGLDEGPEEAAELKKTLFVAHLPPQTKIRDIIRFFNDVGQVVRVLLQATHKGKCVGEGFVEFASANQAKKALEKKKNEYLHKRKIFLDVAHKGALCLPPKYCIDHKVWYQEDYLQQESLRIQENPKFSEEATVLFIANLSPQTTKILHIINFLEDVGDVVSVRLIVNHEGKHVGYGFVEFASANQAKKALENKNGEYLHDHKIFLMKRRDESPNFSEAVATVRNKTICITHFSGQTKISDIINFFKDVGQVVHVRLIVNPKIKHVRLGFVEFASANEAEKALEKNGEYLYDRDIFLDFVEEATYTILSRHCVDHKVWYEDYLQRESLLIEEHAVAETPDFVEDVNLMKTTVFFATVSMKKENCSMSNIINIFKCVGEVVRVRLIVDDWGESLGCGFVEFASAEEAKKAVQEKSGCAIYVKVAEKAPYLFRPKCNLADLAEKLWYEDKLRREGFGLPSKSELRKEEAVFCGKKITFSDKD